MHFVLLAGECLSLTDCCESSQQRSRLDLQENFPSMRTSHEISDAPDSAQGPPWDRMDCQGLQRSAGWIQTGHGCVGRISNPTASALADPGTHRSLAIRYWSVYLHRRFKWMYALTEYPEHNDCSRRSTFPTRLSAPMFQMAHRFQGDSVVHMHLSTIADVGERSFPRCS